MSAEPSVRSLKLAVAPLLRFGPFELNPRSGELHKAGVRVRIQQQPLKVLAVLALNPGRLVTREEIQSEVWPDGTFVDFEQSLNFCIRQIRTALGDQAGTPVYVETLPRRGYRFLAPVTLIEPGGNGSLATEPVADEPATLAPARRTSLSRWALAALLGALALSALAALYLAFGFETAAPAPRFERLTFRRGSVSSGRFGPDGLIVYAASWEGQPESVHTASPGNPDSRSLELHTRRVVGVSRSSEVAFLDEQSTLARAPIAGGPAKEILNTVRTADWSSASGEFAVARYVEGTMRVEYPIGNVLAEALNPSWLRVSPDGTRLALLEHPILRDDRGSVVVLERDGSRRTLSGPWASADGLAWSPDGSEVWFTAAREGADSSLHAVSLEGRERTLVPSMGRLVIHDVAADGRVLLERNTLRLEIKYGQAGQPKERDLSWFDISGLADLSRDGRRVLFYESGEGGGPEYSVFLRDVAEPVPMRLGHGRAMGLSPDGRWVLAIPLDRPDHIELLPTGPGEVHAIRDPGLTTYEWAGWLPDGERILFTARGADDVRRIYLRSRVGGTPVPVAPEGIGLFQNTISPDGGRFVAHCGKPSPCLYSIEGGEPRMLDDIGDVMGVLGWVDDKALLVRSRSDKPLRLLRYDLASGEAELLREILPDDPAGLKHIGHVAITPDGSAWAYNLHRRLSDLYLVEGLR